MADSQSEVGVKVQMRAYRFFRDAAGVSHRGPAGTHQGDAPFRVTAARLAEDAGNKDNDRLFEVVEE